MTNIMSTKGSSDTHQVWGNSNICTDFQNEKTGHRNGENPSIWYERIHAGVEISDWNSWISAEATISYEIFGFFYFFYDFVQNLFKFRQKLLNFKYLWNCGDHRNTKISVFSKCINRDICYLWLSRQAPLQRGHPARRWQDKPSTQTAAQET